MNVEKIAARFNARKSGAGWMARCPAHEDREPSLSIQPGRNGTTLLKCHAGCSIDEVVAAVGLHTRDLFSDSMRLPAAIAPHKSAPLEKFDWDRCVAGMTEKHVEQIATWRGYSPEFVKQLRVQGLIGIHRGLVAFPVHNNGRIIGAHFRLRTGHWKYVPAGIKAAPMVFGDLSGCDSANVFESTWDGLAYLDKSAERARVIITRGATNGALVAGLIPNGAIANLWTQNDEPDPKTGKRPGEDIWQKTVCEYVPGSGAIKRVKIPVHDLNDWTRDGASVRDLIDAIKHAELLRAPESSADTPRNPDDEAIARLAAMSVLDYERVRKDEADKLNVRATILDRLVEAQRLLLSPREDSLQGKLVKLAEVEPWPEPVNGAELLDATAERFAFYVVMQKSAADVSALWCTHTHFPKAFQCSPRLNYCSPEKQCGKTTARDVVGLFVPRPILTENLTTAVLFRLVDAQHPVILADEYDSWITNNEELRGLLNAGHRQGAMVYRCEGESNEVRGFSAYAPAALCGIGALPETLHDRSIVIRLERAKRGELKARFDSRHLEHEEKLNRKLARWCADNRAAIEACEPKLPENAFNRVADNWRPLFAIAQIAGGDWPTRCADAFAKLTNTDSDAEGTRVMLLADIQQVFADERMFSKDLVAALVEMKERPWPEANHGKPITERWLARNLTAFGIRSGNIRIGENQAKGYERTDFEEAFARYLPDTPPVQASHRPNTYENS
jgi:putative DNA primase/helicase